MPVQYPPPELWRPLIPVESTRFQGSGSPLALDTMLAADLPAKPPLFEHDVAGWQLAERVTPARMVGRAVSETELSHRETMLYQRERDRAGRSVALSVPAHVRVRAVSTADWGAEPESDRVRRFDAALRDRESGPMWPLEGDADSGLWDSPTEPDSHEPFVWETHPE